MKKPPELTLAFTTNQFKLSGPVPDHECASNGHYGRDLAAWLVQALPAWSLLALDEDWGWLVTSRRDPAATARHSLCLYGFPREDSPDSDLGE